MKITRRIREIANALKDYYVNVKNVGHNLTEDDWLEIALMLDAVVKFRLSKKGAKQ